MISYRELAAKICANEQFIANYYYEETPNYPHTFHIVIENITWEKAYQIVSQDLHEHGVTGDHLYISAWDDIDIFLDYLLKKGK